MAGFPLQSPIFQGLNDLGAPLAGGLVYIYVAGTSTPVDSWSDQATTVVNANPVVLDAAGRAQIWIKDASTTLYKIVVKTSAGVTVYTADGVSIPATPAAPAASAVPAGCFFPYGGATAPTGGWLLCDGSAISRTTYAALFTAIGTSYGSGNGTTTFNIPDTRQRVVLGLAVSGTGNALGATGGTIDHVHTGPSHTHDPGTLTVASSGAHTHTTGAPSATADVQSGTGEDAAGPTHTHDIASSGAHTHAVTGASAASGTGNTGTGNMPFVTANWIIKT